MKIPARILDRFGPVKRKASHTGAPADRFLPAESAPHPKVLRKAIRDARKAIREL